MISQRAFSSSTISLYWRSGWTTSTATTAMITRKLYGTKQLRCISSSSPSFSFASTVAAAAIISSNDQNFDSTSTTAMNILMAVSGASIVVTAAATTAAMVSNTTNVTNCEQEGDGGGFFSGGELPIFGSSSDSMAGSELSGKEECDTTIFLSKIPYNRSDEDITDDSSDFNRGIRAFGNCTFTEEELMEQDSKCTTNNTENHDNDNLTQEGESRNEEQSHNLMSSPSSPHVVLSTSKSMPDESSSSSSSSPHPFRIEAYDFRPSLIDDMEKADLILSHAGAGTVMEVLRMTNSNNNNSKDDKDSISKKLIVVINTILMDNHQLELATAMADRGHLFVVHQPEQLQQTETWTAFEDFVPTCLSHQIGDSYDFPILLDSFLGFPPDNINKIQKSE
mmetsp:Transcript_69154/g.77370  ORF Transcript_69154/g.77370 Transcript_69154/m.77370 type:complete len:394 (+) Transcript_69154:138-1319(+)